MAKISDIYGGGQFVTAASLPTDKHTIAEIAAVNLEQIGQDQTAKVVLDLRSPSTGGMWPKQFVLNKTNSLMLATAYGDDTDDWSGKIIELWSEPTTFRGEPTMGIKVAARTSGTQQNLPPATRPAWNNSKANGGGLDDEIPF